MENYNPAEYEVAIRRAMQEALKSEGEAIMIDMGHVAASAVIALKRQQRVQTVGVWACFLILCLILWRLLSL